MKYEWAYKWWDVKWNIYYLIIKMMRYQKKIISQHKNDELSSWNNNSSYKWWDVNILSHHKNDEISKIIISQHKNDEILS